MGDFLRELLVELRDAVTRHKWGLAALALAFVAGALVACGPKAARAETGPKKPTLPAVRATVAGDTVTIKAPIRSTTAVDSIVAVIALPGSGKPNANFKFRAVVPNVTDTATVVWPGIAPGTYTGTVTATAYRGSCVVLSACRSPAASRTFTVTVQQAPPPAPEIDSVQVSAIKLFVVPPAMGRTVAYLDERPTICSAYGFAGDRWAIRSTDAMVCGAAFAAQFTALQRAVSTAQQLEIDRGWTTEWDSVAVRVSS